MSLVDILFRVDSICLKYDKYDVEKQRSGSLNDAFGRLYSSFESQIDAIVRVFFHLPWFHKHSFLHIYIYTHKCMYMFCSCLQKSEIVATETNRAKVVAMNAEIRRTKARLLEEIPKLQKLAQKKVQSFSIYILKDDKFNSI